MNKRTLVILLIAALLLIIAGLAVAGMEGWSYSPFRSSYEQLLTADGAQVEAVRVTALSTEVRFYDSWDDTLQAEVSGSAVRYVSAQMEGYTLVLTETEHRPWDDFFHRNSYDDYAVVWLPASFSGRIEAVSESGDVTLSSLPNSSITASVTTDSGDVDIYGSELPELAVATSSGDVSIYDSRIGELRVATDSGDVWLGTLHTDRAIVASRSGTVYGSLEDAGESDVSITSETGDVYVDY